MFDTECQGREGGLLSSLGASEGAEVWLELDSKLDGSGFPVSPALQDERGQVTGLVVDSEAGAVERKHIEELVL